LHERPPGTTPKTSVTARSPSAGIRRTWNAPGVGRKLCTFAGRSRSGVRGPPTPPSGSTPVMVTGTEALLWTSAVMTSRGFDPETM